MSKPDAQNRLGSVHKSTPGSAPSIEGAGVEDEYELKLDDQVAHFLQLKHTLTYFVITATVGTFGFTINLLITNKLLTNNNPWGVVGVSVAALASLLGAASSLVALRCDVESNRLHLQYRHERKKNTDLTLDQMAAWNSLNWWAKWMRECSFVFLGFTVLIQFILIVFLFIVKRESTLIPSGFSSILQ